VLNLMIACELFDMATVAANAILADTGRMSKYRMSSRSFQVKLLFAVKPSVGEITQTYSAVDDE